jgi:hypothetical protein
MESLDACPILDDIMEVFFQFGQSGTAGDILHVYTIIQFPLKVLSLLRQRRIPHTD